ncbi:MAG: 2-amino-4-hydroxy-6-hydroxymethyldihydropteridine diphosphokinase [Bacteroidota bacterium]
MNEVVIMLGSNMGDRQHHLHTANNLIASSAGSIKLQSKIYETASWGDTSQQSFYNQAIRISTDLAALDLLHLLLGIENQMGRKRNRKWEPRIIDLDIIYYNTDVIKTAELTIPHPLLQERRFVLVPLAEIVPSFIHPVLHKDTLTLLAECMDDGSVTELQIR